MTDCQTCPHSRGTHGPTGCLDCFCPVTHAALIRDGIAEGERRRDDGIGQILEASPLDEWRDLAYHWIDQLPAGTQFTSTDLVDSIGIAPSPNAVGAVIRARSVAGAIEQTGRYVRSARPSCHAAIVAVWVRAWDRPPIGALI